MFSISAFRLCVTSITAEVEAETHTNLILNVLLYFIFLFLVLLGHISSFSHFLNFFD